MRLHIETGYLPATSPFDLSKSLGFLGTFAPTQDEQTISQQKLTKAISIERQPIVFQIASIGNVEAPQLEYTLFSEQPIAVTTKKTLVDRMTFFLSLKDNLRPFYAIALDDPAFVPIIRQLYGYHQVKFLTPFENACWAVMSQRNPIASAKKQKQALVEQFGSSLKVNATIYWAFPEASHLATVDMSELVSIVRNERRAEYLISIAHAFSTVDEGFLRTGNYDEVAAWLRSIKGLGEWSAPFVLLRGLGRMEQVPTTEKRVFESAAKIYGEDQNLTKEAIEHIAAKYGRYQGYWAHYLRVSS